MHKSSVLPNNLEKQNNESLDSVTFSTDDISTKLSDLELNQIHGNDILSTRMIKLCGNSIYKPLSITFNVCLKEGKFSFDWIKAHVESLIYNELLFLFTDNKLISPTDSSANKLLLAAHEMYKSLMMNLK